MPIFLAIFISVCAAVGTASLVAWFAAPYVRRWMAWRMKRRALRKPKLEMRGRR